MLKEANNMFCELRVVPLVVIGLIVLERVAKGNYITAVLLSFSLFSYQLNL